MATSNGSIPSAFSRSTSVLDPDNLCTMETLLKGADSVPYFDPAFRPRYLAPARQVASPLQVTNELSKLTVGEVAVTWLTQHSTYIKANTIRVYRQYVKSVLGFLGENLSIARIDINSVRTYQKWRLQTACATRINSEVSVLKQILCEAGLWERIGLLYKPLPLPKKKVRQNMSEEEERRLMAVA